ncbi:PACE efflux transporter [Rhodobacteraceae bacterium]|nr:PACE efflux transporter [Paracoccaceae bacterium]
MRTTADRIRQALCFEILGLVLVTPLFSWGFNHPVEEIGVLALLGATTATIWNYVFNLGFDHALMRWRGRVEKNLWLRIVHATLFEATLLTLLLPIVAWWLEITLLQALFIDLSFAAFYVVYAFVFTWGYERVFPPSGRAVESA